MAWEDKFDNLSKHERAIVTINQLTLSESQIEKKFSPEERKKIMIIPFEQFAKNPQIFLEKVKQILNTAETEKTLEVMKSANVPREFDEGFIAKKRLTIERMMSENNVSEDCKELMFEMAENYESEYLK